MMTDPAFAIKNQVQQLVDVQIETLRKPSSLTSSELDEYRSQSERISALRTTGSDRQKTLRGSIASGRVKPRSL